MPWLTRTRMAFLNNSNGITAIIFQEFVGEKHPQTPNPRKGEEERDRKGILVGSMSFWSSFQYSCVYVWEGFCGFSFITIKKVLNVEKSLLY